MSLSVGPWAAECDELRLCLDRSSDSDHSQLAISELIDSITCEDDGVRDDLVVADVVDRLLDQVEADVKTSRHSKGAVRRKRDSERKKSRRRSTSCSTTSSACSEISRKHRRKQKHHRRKCEDQSPRVNPIFLWVKQDDTRIVEVLCEDYDKRNRIRLTKTAHGWRATPRTERLDSTLSKSSLDLSPVRPTTPPPVHQQPVLTKEMKPKRCVAKKYKRCDKKKDKSFNGNSCVDEYNNVDVVNNNNSSISNNNKVKVEHSCRPTLESSLLDSRLRSYGYKKACHERLDNDNKYKKRDNNMFDDADDVYTFVPTPKTDYEDNCQDQEVISKLKRPNQVDSDIKTHALPKDEDFAKVDSDQILDPLKYELATVISKCEDNKSHLEESQNIDEITKSVLIEGVINNIAGCPEENNPPTTQELSTDSQISSTEKEDQESCKQSNENIKTPITNNQSAMTPGLEILSDCHQLQGPQSTIEESDNQQLPDSQIGSPQERKLQDETQSHQSETKVDSVHEHSVNEKFEEPQTSCIEHLQNSDTKLSEFNFNEEMQCTIDSSTADNEDGIKINQSSDDIIEQNKEEDIEDDEEPLPEVILPEPHLQTPEPSPQPLPEPSTTEQESIIREISLQPETSLDSDTIHLPDTTTKSETPISINRDISLSQSLSLKQHSEINIESSLLPESLHLSSKNINHNSAHSQNEIKSGDLIQQAEIERQITADLDEDHLLAIEEILQGKECVEDFDDLPEASSSWSYPDNHESPVNLVIDLKAKDQVDITGIPLSLRTDDFLEWPSSIKDNSDIVPSLTKATKKIEPIEKQIPHAHQQTKTKFLQSILSCPKSFHKDTSKKPDCSEQQEPLYLGVSRKSASPTVSSSDGRKFSSPELEPKPKRMKVEDITLKTILNKNRESYHKTKISKSKDCEETQQTADSTTKSRLLELLTNENDDHINKLDPLTQLKEVLSDPDLNVPDPLLVPRARLPALVANPGKEIPRLLAMKTENLYPKLLTDPDLLVVSLSHLQSLLQAAGKEEEMMKYQQHAQLLQQQMKQEQATLDAATAAALNQMMWLPYLSQLEAAAMACGNSQDFMTMLNTVYPQMSPYLMTPSPGVNAYDYKSQLEFQQAFALWNEAMMQAASNQFAAQTLGASGSNNTPKMYSDAKFNPKQSHSNSSAKQHQDNKHASARTSPITLNYQQNKYRASQFPYQSMFGVPTSTHATSTARTPSSTQSYKSASTPQRSQNYSSYAGLTIPKTESKPINRSVPLPPPRPKPPPELKNLNHHLPSSTTMIPCTSSKIDPPKLKVKQPQHLVDPHSRPRLLNVMEEHGEVGSTTGSHPTDDAHHNLWHPLFSR